MTGYPGRMYMPGELNGMEGGYVSFCYYFIICVKLKDIEMIPFY